MRGWRIGWCGDNLAGEQDWRARVDPLLWSVAFVWIASLVERFSFWARREFCETMQDMLSFPEATTLLCYEDFALETQQEVEGEF